MKPEDLLEKATQAAASAKLLLTAGDADGACNRAYYAMFDAACAILLANGYKPGKTHKGVLNAFSSFLLKNKSLSKELGRLLKRSEAIRYVADYGADKVGLEDAREIVTHAETFVLAIANSLKNTAALNQTHPPSKPAKSRRR